MENTSPSPSPIDWNWNEANHSVGPFQLRGSIKEFADILEKMERFPYEDFDTYLIKGTVGSKLFVGNKGISSIQCGEHFIVNGTDVIGLGASALASHFTSPFSVTQKGPGYTDYMNKDRTLKVIVDDAKDAILWVVYFDPAQW